MSHRSNGNILEQWRGDDSGSAEREIKLGVFSEMIHQPHMMISKQFTHQFLSAIYCIRVRVTGHDWVHDST